MARITSYSLDQTITSGDKVRIGAGTVIEDDHDAILNRSWLYPYAPGGLRNGDTVWMNMTLNNPHAIEGLFAKSRGTNSDGGRGDDWWW